MWGPREPAWAYVREMADWIARTQLILQSGIPRVDVGLYRHKYISVDIKHVRNFMIASLLFLHMPLSRETGVLEIKSSNSLPVEPATDFDHGSTAWEKISSVTSRCRMRAIRTRL